MLGCRHAGRSRVSYNGFGGHTLGYHAWKRGGNPVSPTPSPKAALDNFLQCSQLLLLRQVVHCSSLWMMKNCLGSCRTAVFDGDLLLCRNDMRKDICLPCRFFHVWHQFALAGGHWSNGGAVHDVLLLVGHHLALCLLVRASKILSHRTGGVFPPVLQEPTPLCLGLGS